MAKINKRELIKELRYAQQLHLNRAKDSELSVNERRRNKRVSQQKEMIIQALQGKIPVKENYIRVIKRWLKIHQMWVDYFEYYLKADRQKKLSQKRSKELKAEIKEEGGVNWHKKWIRVYKEILNYLEKLRKR